MWFHTITDNMTNLQEVLIVHNSLLDDGSQMANTDVSTAVFSEYDWPRAHGLVATFAIDRGLKGCHLCDAFRPKLDDTFRADWMPYQIKWIQLEVKGGVIVGKNAVQDGMRGLLPRGMIYIIHMLVRPQTPAPRNRRRANSYEEDEEGDISSQQECVRGRPRSSKTSS